MASAEVKKRGILARISRFVKDMIGEMKKVVWPNRKQALNNTLVVLVFMLFMALVIFIFDLGVSSLLSLLFTGNLSSALSGIL